MKTLEQLAQFIKSASPLSEGVSAVEVKHLSIDSRQIQAGDCFIALQGLASHGLDYLESVLKRKPALILSDSALTDEQQALLASYSPCSFWQIENLESKLAVLADWFYDQPSQRVKVVGITGTNGKTSTAFYTAQLLTSLGQKVALIGTLGNGLFGNQALDATSNTTPDVTRVHRLLADYADAGAQWVVMEVSSHALELDRIQQVHFETVSLTQVTRDHMDFHCTVEAYQQAKMKLFTDYQSQHKVLNLSDPVGAALAKALTGTSDKTTPVPVWGYFLGDQSRADGIELEGLVSCGALELLPHGLVMELSLQNNTQTVLSPLMGAFNAENLLCALSIVLAGFNVEDQQQYWSLLLKQLAEIESVDGRMQQIGKAESCPTIIIDFAHTPDALQQVLSAVKQHLSGQTAGALWVVFGCGGDRDQGKRPLMAEIAEEIADRVIVTNDNPRFESPEQIVEQVILGFKTPLEIAIEQDRKLAIEQALSLANKQDIIVIAGKGHEDYQDIKGVKRPFSDSKVVLDWMALNECH